MGQDFVYSEGNTPIAVTNEMLQCRDCRYVGKKVGECEKFKQKPADVLAGRGLCSAYRKAEGQPAEPDGPSRYTSESPDCEGCAFNFGKLHCAVYDTKPMDVVIGHKPCEKRQ